MQVIKPNAPWAPEESMSEPQSPEDAITAIDMLIQQRLAPYAASIDRIYALLRHLHTDKKFMAAVEAVNKEAQEAQKPRQDPRLDELASEVQSLKQGLPKVIAETMKGLMGEMSALVRNELSMHQAAGAVSPPNDELEDGEHEG